MAEETEVETGTELMKAAEAAGRLSGVQQVALRVLGGGQTIEEAAVAAGVDRRTVSRWIHRDAEFGAAYNLWKRETLEAGRAKALSMADAALGTIAGAIAKGNVHAALAVAKNLGVLKEGKVGETDAGRLGRKRRVRAAKREGKLRSAEESAAVRQYKDPETVAEVDELLAQWQSRRDWMIKRDEEAWRYYELTQQETDGQIWRSGFRRPKGPPGNPRPSEADVRAMAEREARREGKGAEWVEEYMASARGKIALDGNFYVPEEGETEQRVDAGRRNGPRAAPGDREAKREEQYVDEGEEGGPYLEQGRG